MRPLIMTLVSTLLGGMLIGILTSNAGSDRREYLVDVHAVAGFSTYFAIFIGIVLLALQAWTIVIYARGFSARLSMSRVVWVYVGTLLLGLAIGSLGVYLWGWGIEIGQSNTNYGSEPGTPWNVLQWTLFVAPVIVQVLLVVAGIVCLVIGAPEFARIGRFFGLAGRLRTEGVELKGRVVAVEDARGAPGSTRVVAEFAAPDGVRLAESIVPGTRRAWIASASKVSVWVSKAAPYDPSQAVLRIASFWNMASLPVSALPPATPHGAPQQPTPQYGVPQHGAPQYGAPQYGAPQYGAPQQPAQQQPAPQYGSPHRG